MNKKGIAVAGNMIVDMLYPTYGMPKPGELVTVSGDVDKSTGGCLCNDIVDLAKLDPEMRLVAVGRTGDDEAGKYIMEKMREHKNIDLSHVKITGVSSFTLEDKDGNRVTVLVEDGIRSASTGENTLVQIVEEDAWVSAVGIQYRSGQDTVIRVRNCDEILLVREKEIVYRVVDGEYTVWIRKDGKSIYMEVEGPAEEFLGIEVDGQMIDQSHYQTTLHGNLFFRIWPRYLKTLEAGKHSVVFKFRDGEAKARLVVWNYADSPYTGDPAGIWFAAMLLSGTALMGIRKKRVRR